MAAKQYDAYGNPIDDSGNPFDNSGSGAYTGGSQPPPVSTTGGNPAPLVTTAPDTTTTDPYRSTKLRFPTANDWFTSVLNDKGQIQNLGGMQGVVDLANKIYGLPSGSGAQYYGVGAHGAGSQDVVGLPGGYFAHANNDPNGAWQWNAGGDSGGGSSGGTSFADPAYQQLNDLVQQALGHFSGSASFPQLDQYMQMLQQNIGLQRQYAQTFADQLNQRVTQLDQPLLSDANVAQQHALASNSLLAQRDTALANKRQQRFSSGFAPTSGLIDSDQRAINEQYGNQQAQIDAQLQSNQIQGDESRRNLATNLHGLAAQALAGGNLAALQSQAQSADMENQLYNLNNQRVFQQLGIGQIPVDLTNQGFTNSINASNLGGNPLNSILQLLQLGNGQQSLQQNGQNSNNTALAWLLQMALQ